ncbi:SPOR domain-containing protein [Bacteroidota bacterium]
MKLIISIIISFLLFGSAESFSQTAEVKQCLKLIAEGKIDEAKRRLPDLLADYPDDPGVKMLHGVVIEDGYKAVEKYTDIITDYPESEWADDAYWRIVQFHSIIGDTTQAKLHLNNFRKKYPGSEFLIPATDAVKVAVFRHRKNINAKSFEEIDLTEKPAKPIEETKIEEIVKITEDLKEDVNDSEKNLKAKKKKYTPPKYGLQVGIYSTYEAAKQEVGRYKNLRMLAEIKQKKIGNETMYAVVIGDYSKKISAENAKPIVKQKCNCIPIIFEK